MKEFKLCAHVTVSAYTIVKAETLEEAIEKSKNRDVNLVGFGETSMEDEWLIYDADGLPTNIHED